MKHISVRTAITATAVLAALTVGTVAIAQTVPDQPAPAITETPAPTPDPTQAGTGEWTTPNDGPQNPLFMGMRQQDFPAGLVATVTSSGVAFTYNGPCLDPSAKITVWSNVPGMWKSQGDACRWAKPGAQTRFGSSLTWGEDTRNSYCYSPGGAQSAYRAEVFGLVTEWVPIPEPYKQCINNQAPEGKIYSSPTPTTPTTAPSPSVTSSPSPTSTASPSPTSTP